MARSIRKRRPRALMRPTMIRFLNPTQNFLLIGQFMHTVVPGLDEREDRSLVSLRGGGDLHPQTGPRGTRKL